jgi:hypothetical protein
MASLNRTDLEFILTQIKMAEAGHRDRRATPAFLRQLQENEFKDRQVKVRLRSPDGKAVVGDLGQSASAA